MCGAYLGRSCAHRDHQKQDPPNRERGGRVRLGLRVAIARDADAAPACRCPNTALPPLGNSNTDLVPHPPRHTPAALLDRGGRRMARGVRPASENIGPSWNPRPPRRQIASHHRFKLQAVERHSGNCPTLHCPTLPRRPRLYRFYFAVSEFSQGNGGDFEVAEVSSCKRLVKASMFKLNCHSKLKLETQTGIQ